MAYFSSELEITLISKTDESFTENIFRQHCVFDIKITRVRKYLRIFLYKSLLIHRICFVV